VDYQPSLVDCRPSRGADARGRRRAPGAE